MNVLKQMRSVKIVIIIDTGAFFAVLCFKWSVKKYWVAKILLALWDAFLHEKNCNYNLWKFCYKSAILQRHAEFNSFYDEIFFIVSWGDYVKKKTVSESPCTGWVQQNIVYFKFFKMVSEIYFILQVKEICSFILTIS